MYNARCGKLRMYMMCMFKLPKIQGTQSSIVELVFLGHCYGFGHLPSISFSLFYYLSCTSIYTYYSKTKLRYLSILVY